MAANVWWRCAQYFVNASCVEMPRDNRCMYMAHVCFMSVVVTGGLWECCCVTAVVKDSGFLSLGVLMYVVCLCKRCDGCFFSVCIVTRGAVGARVWEV